MFEIGKIRYNLQPQIGPCARPMNAEQFNYVFLLYRCYNLRFPGVSYVK